MSDVNINTVKNLSRVGAVGCPLGLIAVGKAAEDYSSIGSARQGEGRQPAAAEAGVVSHSL